MCGISVLFAPSSRTTADIVRRMTDAVRHRGPDDEGYALFTGAGEGPHCFGGPDTPDACFGAPGAYAPRRAAPAEAGFLALGHRRLAILDVSPAGHQPMASPDGRYWLVYNGEVYNYLELRDELAALGHRFRTGTDTEVLLAAYAEWGEGFLSRLNGMFALVLYDRATGTLLAARDRFGVKPLYYWVSPDGSLAFASEIKQLTALPGWSPRLNGQRVYDFLNWRITDHTGETLFDGVHQLRGGEVFTANLLEPGSGSLPGPGGKLRVRSWYSLRHRPFEGSFEEAAQGFRDLLVDSVRLRLRSDVAVGTCLSGGLDSSSLVCAMNQLLHGAGTAERQKTFSSCSHHKRFDERDYIEAVVRHTGVDAHYVYPSPDELFDTLGRITWHQDEPFASTSIYAQWHVFALARANGVTVMLDGQGADEQLAGYETFFAPRFAGLLKELRWLTLWREISATRDLHGRSPALSLMQMGNVVLPGPLRSLGRRLRARTRPSPEWLDMDRLGAVSSDPFAERGTLTGDVRELSRAQLTATNLQMLLHWEDRDSMAHSVESRVPFLDYRLVEFVLGLPVDYKIAGGMTKRVLREGMKGLLPERVRTRVDKLGFATPEEVWVRSEASDRFRAAAATAVEASRGVLQPSSLAKVDRIIAGDEPFERFPWRIISFGSWLEAFDVRV